MRQLLCALVFSCLLALAFGQFLVPDQPSAFVGQWTANTISRNGFMFICQDGNKVYGSFTMGYFEGVLTPDRRTIAGNVYSAGNTGETEEGEFRVSMLGDDSGFVGWLFFNGESMFWSESRLTTAGPSGTQCWNRGGGYAAEIGGRWSTGSGDVLEICTTDDGFGFEAVLGGKYMRGPTLSGLKAGRGAWWETKLGGETYGGVIFSLLSDNTLVLSTHTLDMSEVISEGCNQGGPSCKQNVLYNRVGESSPGACAKGRHNAYWSGFYTYSPQNGELALRRLGYRVVGSWDYGVLEGTLNEDSSVLTGVWWSANWQPNKKAAEATYFGRFEVEMAADQSSFDGWIWLNNDDCELGSRCKQPWSESRVVGRNREPTADEAFQQSHLFRGLNGANNIDGTYYPDYNEVVRMHLCRNRYFPRDRPNRENPIVTDDSDRQRISGTYTDFGTGRIEGSVRTDTEAMGMVAGPANSTANYNWVDASGFGKSIARKIDEETLIEYWFYERVDGDLPDLSQCDYVTEFNCGRYVYKYLQPATWAECSFGDSASSALVVSISLMVIAFVFAILQ